MSPGANRPNQTTILTSDMEPLEPSGMVGRTFGERFSVRADLGSSAVADTFVALDLVEGTLVALKVFDQSIGEDPSTADTLGAVLERNTTLEHPGLVPVIDWGIDGVRVWVASVLARGGSLRAMLDRGERMSPSQALVMGLECTRALAYLHDQGIVHGDVRPANLLFTEDQRLLLADVGLAQSLADHVVTRPALAVERVAYLSPEQARQRELDGRSDVYSLALLLNEAVTGEPPAVGDTVVATRANRGGSSVPISADLAALRQPLERCGRIEAHERPEAGELSISLLAAAERLQRPGPLPLAGLPMMASMVVEQAVANQPAPAIDTPAADEADEADGAEGEAATNELSADADGSADIGLRNSDDNDEGDVVDEVIQRVDGGDLAESGLAESNVVDADADVALDDVDALDAPVLIGAAESRPALAAVPDLADESPALDDLASVAPVFAAPAAEEPPLDVPSSPNAAPGSSFEADLEDLDSDLPWWPLAVLAGLVAAVVGASVFFAGVGTTSDPELPQVVGLDAEAARATIVDQDWQVEQLEIRRDGTVAGEVVGQDPPAGTRLGVDQVVTLTVSLGGELIEIPPDLPGLSLEQAQERLRLVNLVVGTVTQQSHESVESGLVIAVDEPTRQKAANTAVALLVSTGPEDRVVPDVVGSPVADATVTLAGQRLQAVEQPEFDAEVEPGIVLRTNPPAGTTVEADAQVILEVSAGPEPVEIPDLSGLGLAEATAALDELGLIFADTEGVPGEPVIATIPPAGETVDVGTEVTVVLDDPDGDEEN